jgi:hypothetical protein
MCVPLVRVKDTDKIPTGRRKLCLSQRCYRPSMDDDVMRVCFYRISFSTLPYDTFHISLSLKRIKL